MNLDFGPQLEIFLIVDSLFVLRILVNVWKIFMILDPNSKSPMNSVLIVCFC